MKGQDAAIDRNFGLGLPVLNGGFDGGVDPKRDHRSRKRVEKVPPKKTPPPLVQAKKETPIMSHFLGSIAAFAAAPVFFTSMLHTNEAVGFILAVFGAK